MTQKNAQQYSPLQKRSASKSLLNKFTGSLLMVIGTVLALFGIAIVRGAFFDYIEHRDSLTPERWYFTAICGGITIVGIVVGRMGWRVFRKGKQLSVISAEELLSRDQRPPVVYIRSFRDDKKKLTQADAANLTASSLSVPIFAVSSQEETIARVFSETGPFVAIGNPKEQLPELGAARMYFSNDEWQSHILEMMQKSKLTILLAGPTQNLWWEIEQAIKHTKPTQLLCIELFEKGVDHLTFEQNLEAMVGKPGAISHTPHPPSGLFSWRRAYGRVIYFDQDWTPKSEVIRVLSPGKALYNNTVNQFEPALRVALRTVFSNIGLPGPTLPVNKTMVMILIFVALAALLVLYILITEPAVFLG